MASTCAPMPQISRYSNGSTHSPAFTLNRADTISSYASDTPTVPPAVYHTRQQIQDDRLAEFFGASRKSRAQAAASPPYSSEKDFQLPAYDANAEPMTLARFMFIYGFIFPPFWIMGIVIRFSELRPAEDWGVGKSEDEKDRLMAEMRTTEVKWANRCIYALLTLITIIAVIVTAVVVTKRRS